MQLPPEPPPLVVQPSGGPATDPLDGPDTIARSLKAHRFPKRQSTGAVHIRLPDRGLQVTLGKAIGRCDDACIHTEYTHRVYTMKRTNIVLDEALVKQALELTGIKTQKDLVDHALRQLVRRESQLELLRLRGKVAWEGDLSEMRKARVA